MDQKAVFLTIIGMGLVTYLPRFLPLWLLASRTLPPIVAAWLRHVPVAVLSAMLLPALLIQEKQINLMPDNLFLYAAVPTVLTAWKTRSFFGAVLVGMCIVAGARYVFGL